MIYREKNVKYKKDRTYQRPQTKEQSPGLKSKASDGGFLWSIFSSKFYAVSIENNEEYTVRSKSQEIGTIVMPPPISEKIALAGHVWIKALPTAF